MSSPRPPFLAPDGQAYRVGVRWYYGHAYHPAPPRDGKGSRYRLFAPAAGGEWVRSYALDDGTPAVVDAAELERQFRASGWVTLEAAARPAADPR